MTHFARNFVALFVAINPISVLTFFVALTADCTPALKLKLSVKSVLVAFAVILFFIVVAEFIIEAMGLSLRSFQVAGGIILFLVAISLVLGTGEIGSPSARTDYDGMAIFPLAVPGICGPATMLTAMVLADDNRFGMLEQLQTALAGALVLAITLVLLLFAEPVHRAIGTGVVNVIRRVMGMLLAAFAVKLVFSGLAPWLGLPEL